MDKYYFILVIFSILRGFEGKFHSKKIEDEQMIVAFKCGHPNVYFTDGLWKRDKGFVCPKNNNEILNYCKHVYPDFGIENIMETVSDKVIPSWCQKGDKPCLESFVDVVPYKCLAGKFQNEALLVPAPCIFDHLHNSSQCMTARSWSEMAGKSCKGRGLVHHRSSMLKPCGLNQFTGVEFVCCPSSFEGGSVVVTAQQADNKTGKESSRVVEAHKGEQPADGVVSSRAKIVEAYLNRKEWRNEKPMTEHDFYLKAKKDLAKHHKQKVDEMINDWNSARSRAMQLEEVNKKEGEKLKKQLSERFQKLYEAEEVENEMEKKQLSDLHQQRVAADLNGRKQKALDHYLTTIDEEKPELGEIVKALKHLIKVLHKDRLHTVNRFKHLADTDPSRADAIRESSANHVSELDRQLEEAVSLLDRIPKFRDKIRNLIADHMDSYHSVDASVFIVIEDELKELPRIIPETTPAKVVEDDYILDVGDADKKADGDDDDYFKVVEDDKHENDDKSFPRDSGKTGGFFKIDPDDVKKFKHGESVDSDEHGYRDEATMKSSEQSTRLPDADRKQVVNLGGTVGKQKSEPEQAVSSDEDEDRSEDLKEMEVVSSIDGDIYDRHFFQNPDHMHKSGLSVEQAPKFLKHSPTSIPGPNFGAAIPLGVAVGTLTVAVVIAIGVLVMRRRGGAGGLYHSPSVDAPAGAPQNGSPEERHVANMQINGYENPTYKYFERYQQSPTDA